MDGLVRGVADSAMPDSFDRWLGCPGEWVEAPNQRRGGLSGVQRLQGSDGRLRYRKQQVEHCYRDWRHPFGEPTILREARAFEAFAALGVRVPALVYCGTRRGLAGREALLVTEALAGFDSLESCYARQAPADWGGERHAEVFRRIGAVLARLHLARWQHGCLYPKHIFVRVDEGRAAEVALLDLEKSRRRLSRGLAARHDLRQLRRHADWGALEWGNLEAGYREITGQPFEG
ncbi:lipopolysaccharide kinase InaA family protein [Stutzerimonas tarimensis]|uniref:Lipopolysaccharide kinase InaA family protein n=1 Tax=Stutzerimonas tarimensis TaxID=1507735 RepID=A0ABV7T2V4_9GAMM